MKNVQFLSYLFANRKMLLISAGISIAAFLLLKFLYPDPDLFSDSNSYIIWAQLDFKIGYRPMGYSYFLKYVHALSDRSMVTVLMQYLLFVLSSWFCFFSVDFLFGIPTRFKWFILLAVQLNPMLLLQTNLISSDSVFCSLTVIWLTLCLWIVVRRQWWALVLQLVLLYCCFEVRYTAMFFPIVACIVFLVSPGKWVYKSTSAILTVLVIFLCAQRQKYLYKQEAGVSIVSAFSGWQLANNALYCYKHIDLDPTDLPSIHAQRIDHEVKRYIDSVKIEEGKVGSAYIWTLKSPLKMLCFKVTKYDKVDYILAWMRLSVDYSEYGWYIIRHFPGAFFEYYIVPNTGQFFYPDLETLADYNSGEVQQNPRETAEWYSPRLDSLECRVPGLQQTIMPVFPVLSLLLNLFNTGLLGWCIYLFVKRRAAISTSMWSFILLWGLFYIGFAAFSIFAAAFNLRFMDPVFVLGVFMPAAILHQLLQMPRPVATETIKNEKYQKGQHKGK